MRKYGYALLTGLSLTAIGIGGYFLYQQNQQLGARISVLEKKVEELTIPVTEQNKERVNIYQRIQKIDNKLGEWIKKH